MHTISTFLFGNEHATSKERIYAMIRAQFEGSPDIVLGERQMPVGMPASMQVTSGPFHFTVDYIDDLSMHESLAHAQSFAPRALPVEHLQCEVRTVFGDDPYADYGHIANVMQKLLLALPNAIVFDERQKRVVSDTTLQSTGA